MRVDFLCMVSKVLEGVLFLMLREEDGSEDIAVEIRTAGLDEYD